MDVTALFTFGPKISLQKLLFGMVNFHDAISNVSAKYLVVSEEYAFENVRDIEVTLQNK
jgi:hypothetical protein